jgi:hypothetical protein
MKCKLARKIVFAAALCCAAASWSPALAQSPDGPLTNASVVKLVRAGFREKTVIAIIRARASAFDLSPERLIELKKNGVSERVILAMISHQAAISVASDEWGDDDEPLFKDGGGGTAADPTGRKSDPGEVNIFGNSGGSRGSVRSRGLNGGSEGETQTTGSATVRILRPPAEAGGANAAPKLERTPTLTNDSVVELVEAGFTEGTIIRRIEQSPADFNLSPEKLSELRKRRVSETVIAAMRAAMSDEGETRRPEN